MPQWRITSRVWAWRTRAPNTRTAGRLLRALAIAAAACGLLAPAAAGGETLPLIHVVYEGTVENNSTYSGQQSGEIKQVLEWSASAESNGEGTAGPVTFTRVTGSDKSMHTENSETVCFSAVYSLLPSEAVIPGDWHLEEANGYPSPGWLFEVPPTVSEVPFHEVWSFTCGEPGSGESSYADGVREIYDGLTAGLCEYTPAEQQTRASEELFAPLFVTPGGGGVSTREYAPPACTRVTGGTTFHITVKTKLSARIAGVPGSEEHKSEAKHEEPKPEPSSEPPERKRLEEIRAKIKAAAIKDEIEAYESMTEIKNEVAVGVGGLGDLNALLSEYIAEQERFDFDYEIAEDPPAPSYETLAQPEAVKPRALPACRRGTREFASCRKLHVAAARMLAAATGAAAIDHTLTITLDRDTAALNAANLTAAASQTSHFEALHARFESALAGKRGDGAALAKLLRERHVKGTVSKARDAASIAATEASLARIGIPRAHLQAVLGSALTARKTNFLDALEHGLG